MHILPWPPTGGKPDQVSPLHAADPTSKSLDLRSFPGQYPDVWSSLVKFISRGFLRRADSLVGSGVGLLTVAFLARGDASPADTLRRLVLWTGLDLSATVQNTDNWLNAPQRHRVLVGFCLLVGAGMIVVMYRQIATEHEERDASSRLEQRDNLPPGSRWYGPDGILSHRFAQETRFWSVMFIVTGLLAQLHEVDPARVVAGLATVAAVMVAATRANFIQETRGSRESIAAYRLAWIPDAIFVLGFSGILRGGRTLLALPRAVWGVVAYPMANERRRPENEGTSGP